MIKAKTFILPFLKKEKVAKDTYSFFFDRSKVKFDFLPGQYMYMTVPHAAPDDRGTSRYFTISSSPLEKDRLVITVKILESSFKKALYSLKAGDKVHFFGPMGWFLLPKDEKQEKVFIAGGIGITPFHSLLHFLSDQILNQPITLFASFQTIEDVVFYEELHEVAKKNKKIRVIYTLTQEKKAAKDWIGEIGRISHNLFKKYLTDLQNPVFYIVGSPKMVEETKAFLLDLGVSKEKIQVEDFTGY